MAAKQSSIRKPRACQLEAEVQRDTEVRLLMSEGKVVNGMQDARLRKRSGERNRVKPTSLKALSIT